MPENDGGDTERNRVSKISPLTIPEQTPIVFGFMTCARAAGKSVRECACKLKSGGWLECPPEFRGVLARAESVAAAAEWTARLPPRRPDPEPIGDLGTVPRTPDQIAAAVAAERAQLRSAIGGRVAGFTGNVCSNCQSTRMVRNGVCETCLDCFHSGECG